MDKLPILAPAETANVGGLTLNFTSCQSSSEAPTLVLIHGFGASLESWHDIHPALCAVCPVVRLDLKGHGFSDKPPDRAYSPEDQARLVDAFIESIGLKQVVLAGHSLGGAVALLTCLRNQARATTYRIMGLVLIDSAGYPQPLPLYVRYLRNPLTRTLGYLLSPEHRAHLLLKRIFFVHAQITPERIYRYAYFLDLPGSRNALKQTARQVVPENLEDVVARFKHIDVPALIIWGQQDGVVPLENGHRFHSDLRKSTLKLLPDTGHVPHEERPAEVAAMICDFMRELRSRGPISA